MILADIDIKNYIDLKKLKIESEKELSIQQNGLDCRIGKSMGFDFPIGKVIDTHNKESSDSRFFIHPDINEIVVSPKTNILLVTEEYFEFPDDLMAFCGLRSSVARMGFIAPITIVDAGFKGTLTIELFYGGNNPIKIYSGDRFLHVIFAKTSSPAQFPYNGYYNKQRKVNLPKILYDQP